MISDRVLRRLYSVSAGIVNSKRWADDFTSGIAVIRIRYAIKKDASGSQPAHGKRYVKTVDAMTEALPRVSARICK